MFLEQAQNQKIIEPLKKVAARIIKDFGKVQGLGKKGQDKKMWVLVEQISSTFDFGTFFEIIPQPLEVNQQ